MADNYWDRYWRRESSRRRFLKGTAGAGVGAAGLALVGCGDDDDDDGGGNPTVQLATATPTQPAAGTTASPTAEADYFANAKAGGTHYVQQTGNPPTIDPFGNASFLTKGFCNFAYGRLYKYKTGPGIEALAVRPTPDIAASSEANSDGTEWVIKLRPNVKFHDIAPVSGRAVDADDVKFSFGRLTAEASPNKGQVDFIDKMDVVDATTVKFTLKSPNAAFLDVLADTNLLYILPKEADGGFDPGQKMIGSGPWIFKEYQPDVKMTFDKNPSWSDGGKFPLFDAVEVSIVTEYATRLASFRSAKADSFGINPEDLISVKEQLSDVQYTGVTGPTLSFFYFEPGGAASKDPRIRRAVSMAMNRDDLMELGYNVEALRKGGLEISTPWHNILPAGQLAWWLDPQSDDMGEGKKNFEYNPTEAKALLEQAAAAGASFKYQYVQGRYGKSFDDIAAQQINYLQDIGLKIDTEVQDYNSKYITQTFVGNFQGIAFGYETPFPEAGSYPLRQFSPTDPFNHGRVNDPEMWEWAQAQQRELDEEKRKEIFWNIQKKNGVEMYYVPSVAGAGTSWTAFQGYLKGAMDYRTKGYGQPTEEYPYRWHA